MSLIDRCDYRRLHRVLNGDQPAGTIGEPPEHKRRIFWLRVAWYEYMSRPVGKVAINRRAIEGGIEWLLRTFLRI
jgi:hypothetical protein